MDDGYKYTNRKIMEVYVVSVCLLGDETIDLKK